MTFVTKNRKSSSSQTALVVYKFLPLKEKSTQTNQVIFKELILHHLVSVIEIQAGASSSLFGLLEEPRVK